MDEDNSSSGVGPSQPFPNLQDTRVTVDVLPASATDEAKRRDLCHSVEPSERSPLIKVEKGGDDTAESGVTGSPRRWCPQKLNWNWKNLIATVCLWLTYLFVSAAYSIIGPFFPSEADAKGSTPTTTGFIVSSSPLCVVVLSPILGYLLPRLGLKFTLVAGLFLVGGAFILLAFVSELPSGWIFILFCVLLRMTEGVGSAMLFTAVFTLLPEYYPSKVGTIMGLFELGGGLGFAVGPVIGGFLYQLGGFRLPFISVGGLVILFVIPCIILVKSSDCNANTLSLKMIWKLMTNFVFFVLSMANVLVLASLAFFTPTLEPFLIQQFRLSPLKIGLVFLSGPGVYMLSSLIIGLLSDKLGQRKFIIVGFFLFGLSYFFIGPADFIGRPRIWITCVAYGVTGVGVAMGSIPIYADMLNIAKSIVGDNKEVSNSLIAVVSGIVSSTLSFGEFIGPMISGLLSDFFDFQTSTLLFGEVLIAQAFLILGVTLINRLCSHRT